MTTKQPKDKTCKICREKFTPTRPLQSVCGFDCAIATAKKTREVKERKEHREAKAKIIPRNQRMKEAQTAFNHYIRERDKGLTCICCDKKLPNEAIGGGYDCGHYRSVGSAPHLRFDERNAHGQSKHCNRWLNGNVVNYRQGLIRRIGIEAVEQLEADQTVKKYTTQDLIEITQYYKSKVKQLKLTNKSLCSIYGCDKPVMYAKDKVCQKHYVRFNRNESYETILSRKYKIENPAGYQKIYEPTHKLAGKDGYIYEHRFVIYNKYGDNLPCCELCGKPTNWKTCHIDHIDENVKNNEESNLRPVCRGCNTKRTKRSTAQMLEIDNITMSIMDWSRRDDVKVSHKTIKRRLEIGYSNKDAVYKPAKTR